MSNIVPASKPQMKKEEVLALLAKSGLDLNIPEKLFIVAIRGYYEDSMGEKGKNDRGIYDDAIFVIAPDHFSSWNANTDPSVFKKGISTLKLGLHFYKKGMHKISGPHPYPAFRPDTPDESLPVTRDGVGDSRGIAINLHSGSEFGTSSEGCQTIYKLQWPDFQPMVYRLMDKYHQNRLPYYLIEQHGAQA